MKTIEHPAIEHIKADLAQIEEKVKVPTLADAIRTAAIHVSQHHGDWSHGEKVCALSAAALAVTAEIEG